MRIRKWIEYFFCLRSNVSNDNNFCLKARSENGCGKLHFWGSEIWLGFEEPGGTSPPRIPRSSPPGDPLPPPNSNFAFVYQTLGYYHSNETSLAELLHGVLFIFWDFTTKNLDFFAF